MKKRKLLALSMAFMMIILSGCASEEQPHPVSTTTIKEESPIEISFKNVDWDDLDFSRNINKVCAYTETDIKALASACAKGVSKAANCTFEESWNASYEVVKKMTDCAVQLNELLTIGTTTWNEEDKAKALALASEFILRLEEVNEYISISGTDVESEILEIMNKENSENTIKTTVEEEKPNITINWEDDAFINSVKAFSEYTSQNLSKVSTIYTKGYSIESGLAEQDVEKDVREKIKEAKENAILIMDLLEIKNNWNEAIEESATKTAIEFVLFAEDFKRYSGIVQEFENTTTTATSNTPTVEDASGISDVTTVPTDIPISVETSSIESSSNSNTTQVSD